MAARTKEKSKAEGVAALEAIIKKQEAKLEKQQKTIEEKNEVIRGKDKRLSVVDEEIESLKGIAAQAQTEVNIADDRHSEELTLILNKLSSIETSILKAVSKS